MGEGRCPPYDMRDDSLYVLEYTGASGGVSRTNNGPREKVRINAAIGGWYIGNWGISLDNNKDTYLIDIKSTAGGHEGSTNLAINREDWTYNQGMSDGWACGTGHTEANQLTYNRELGHWARLCWTDWNDNEEAWTWSHYFQTLPTNGDDNREQLLSLPGRETSLNPDQSALADLTPDQRTEIALRDGIDPWTKGPGGVASIISLGNDGFLGVGYQPDPNHNNLPRSQRQMTVSMVKLPATSSGCDRCRTFTHLRELPGRSLWTYDGFSGSLGYVNAQPLTGNEVLLGYATKIKKKDGDWPALEYRAAKVNTDGEILATKRLRGTGWGEEDMWVRLANGCIVFPFVWDSAPGALYGNNGAGGTERFSDELRVTVLCDAPRTD